jgi:hypothetical protein
MQHKLVTSNKYLEYPVRVTFKQAVTNPARTIIWDMKLPVLAEACQFFEEPSASAFEVEDQITN